MAEEESLDFAVLGFELEKLLNLGSGLLATFLFYLTASAYRRHPKQRLIYVAVAFLLFAIKGFLTSLEIFSIEWNWIDPASSLLNFGILLSFFYGVIKK